MACRRGGRGGGRGAGRRRGAPSAMAPAPHSSVGRDVTIERLSPGDRLMLFAGDTWPQEIGALAVLDGRGLWDRDGALRLGELRDRIASRVHHVLSIRLAIIHPDTY